MEVTFVQQLTLFSYAFAPFIPASVLIFAFSRFYRLKLMLVVGLWGVHLFFIYKQLYETRAKHFDAVANKNMAWFVGLSSFLFIWIYKSYFLQI